MGYRKFGFRPYNKVKLAVLQRQEGHCACCAEVLEKEDQFAHHVIPNQCGNPADLTHAWLATELNCVMLCSACHVRSHENGDFRNGAAAPPSYFRWSHRKRQAHQAWVKDVNDRAFWIWGYLNCKAFDDEEALGKQSGAAS